MNIGWDLVDIPPNKDGTFEFTTRWLEAVATFPGGHQHFCYANLAFRQCATPPVLERLSWRIAGYWPGHFQAHREWYFWRHQQAVRREVDVLVSVYRPPLVWRGKSIAIVLDCTKERLATVRGLKNHLMAGIRDYGARRAGRWLAISEWTRRDAACYRGYDLSRIRSAGIPAAGMTARPATGLQQDPVPGLAGRRYAFYCSAVTPRKNHVRLIRAWRRAFPNREILLVLAGRSLPGLSREITETIRQAEQDGFVRALGLVTDSDREWLYAGADFVVYPSLYEGFGMPVLEALRYFKPVLTSSGTATEEVGGGAALLADPASEDDLVAKLQLIAADEALRIRLRNGIPAVLERYSLEHVARELHAGIEYLAGLEGN